MWKLTTLSYWSMVALLMVTSNLSLLKTPSILSSGLGTVAPSSIKEVLGRAKADAGFVNDACILARSYVRNNKLVTSKDAMNAMSIFKLARDATSVLDVIDNLIARNLVIDTLLFNNAIDCCAKVPDWELSINLLRRMKDLGVDYDKVSFSSAISACAKSGRCKESLQLLHEMDTVGIIPDTICFSSAISACASAGQWKESLALIAAMKKRDIPVDAITINSAITACGPAGEWTVALRLVNFMRTEGFRPNAYTYAAAINACDMGGQWDEVLRLLEEMLAGQQQQQQLYASSRNTTGGVSGGVSSGSSTLGVVPFNAAIAAAVRNGRLPQAKELFDRMKALGVTRNTVTYTTLLSGIAKSKWKQLGATVVMDIYRDMVAEGVPRNGAVFGAVISAAERLDDFEMALRLLEEMKAELIPTSSFVYHSVISACGKAGMYDTALSLLDEMKKRGVARTEMTYSLMIGSCKREGKWQEALRLLSEMASDDNRNSSNEAADQQTMGDDAVPSDLTVRLQPDTIAYSSAIAVCVDSKQWGVALELLEMMESAGISRNVVTYNTVIEALSAAGETVRAELVYQGALRAGIYNHWHRRSSYYALQSANESRSLLPTSDWQLRSGAGSASRSTAPIGAAAASLAESSAVMDLHNFPVAVARAALMHVLGDMCMGSVPVGDPLVIITGRGNHAHAKGQRGVLKKELQELCLEVGLRLLSDEDLYDQDIRGSRTTGDVAGDGWRRRNQGDATNKRSSPNPGRLWLTRAATEDWLAEQLRDDEQRRALGSAGGAHGNLFLQVARAKHKRLSTPSSALAGISSSSSSSGTTVAVGSAMNIRAVCPFSTATLPAEQATAVNQRTAPTFLPVTVGDSSIPASVDQKIEKRAEKKGGCPAHAASSVADTQFSATATADITMSQTPVTTAVVTAAEQKVEKKGGCPAHAASPVADTQFSATATADITMSQTQVTTAVVTAAEQKVEKKGGCPAHSLSSVDSIDS